jgi:hypothetical protein
MNKIAPTECMNFIKHCGLHLIGQGLADCEVQWLQNQQP